MNIRRKGLSVAFTATLLSSLLATIAAPLALGAVSVTSAGNVPRGGSSTGTASFQFTENTADCFQDTGDIPPAPQVGNELTVRITDSAGNPTVHFVGTPTVVAPGSLGHTVTLSSTATTNDTININFANSDDFNIEQITVAGLQISADAAAAPGAIRATLDGTEADCVLPAPAATVTATGRLGNPTVGVNYPAGSSDFNIINDAGSCPFVATGTNTGGTLAGNLTFATNAENLPITVNAPVAGVQNVDSPGGTADAGSTATVLNDAAPTTGTFGAVNARVGQVLTYTAGANIGLSRAITANTANTITTAAFPAAPAAGDTYVVGPQFAHAPNEVVTQTGVPNCVGLVLPAVIGSPGTVVEGINLTASTRTFVLPGENNQPGGTATWTETGTTVFGTQTLTFSLNPAGVRFSAPPTVTGTGGLDLDAGAGTAGTCSLSIDRRSCTVTIVGGDAAAGQSITLSNVLLDVDSTVPLGSPVTVTLTTSGGTPVGGGTTGGVATIAFVARVIVATAAQPSIFIGVNDQESGMITLSESMPGFFAGGAGANNTFGLCLATGETFTRAPWAVVTTGNLQLLSGFVGSQSVKGTLFNGGSCAYWTVFSATTGTTPSVIEIRGSANDTTPLASGANNGPRLSVPGGLAPGSTQVRVLVGQQPDVTGNLNSAVVGLVSNAIRAFRSGPIVAAVSQPLCQKGATDCLAGNITITEQFNGQLKAGQVITLRILPRATVQRQDVILKTGVTNDLPIVTTNSGSGLLVSPVNVTCPPSALLGIVLCQATFVVTQQSFGPTLGQITVSNIHYVVAADAVDGPVLVSVTAPGAGAGGPAGSQSVDAVVSNARIGPPPASPATTSILNGTLAGVVKVSEGRTFTAATKVVPVGSYCTWQADMDPASSGERVEVWIAKKSLTAASYSAFTKFSTRAVNSQGLAVFHYDNADQPGWVSVKFRFVGNASHGPASSLARQCKFQG